ncbi:MAG: hypothetical protein J5506_08910 [Prevotella sp.]|nr:hypothetical protein [Prevotella sp.]
MNRKKLLMIVSIIEMMVLASLCYFMVKGILGTTAFFAAVLAVAFITSALVLVIIKKTNNQ